MSERSTEDEIVSETAKFMYSVQSLLSRHAQAANWLERRKVRKEISRAWRQELRRRDVERANDLLNTQQMINRYRAHALVVAQRAADPTIDHARRARDAHGLAEHAHDVRGQVLSDRSQLTEVERGIALDGLDAATAYPAFEPGKLFNRSHRVKGLDALRYRAQVARARRETGYERPAPQQRTWQQVQPAEPVQQEMPTKPEIDERSRADVVQQLRRAQLAWNIGAPTAGPARKEALIELWRNAARAAERAGMTEQEITAEFADIDRNSAYVADIQSTRRPGAEARITTGLHPTEADAVAWAKQQVTETPWPPGVQLQATVHERGRQAPTRISDGSLEHVTAGVRSWTIDSDRPSRRSAEPVPERLEELERKLAVLQRGLEAVTADRDDLRSKLDEAQAREERLKNRNLQLAAEIDQRREAPSTPTLDELSRLAGERDQYKRQRDEAVQALAERTPPADRLGSPERQAEQLRGGGGDQPPDTPTARREPRENTQPWPREVIDQAVNEATRNGRGRKGIDRSR